MRWAVSDLPAGWTKTTFGEATTIVAGGTPSSKVSSNFTTEGGIPWITPSDLSGYKKIYISRGARNLTEKGLRESSAKVFPAGSVLFSSRAPVGYVAIAANDVSTNQGFKSFVLPKELNNKFIYFYLRHIKPVAEMMATGTTFKELSASNAAKLPLLVPPLDEQTRIAEKLDSLLARVDSCQTHLERVPQILKRFRQSVLAAATSGRLTEDWRDKRGQSKGNISFDFMDANCFGDYEFPDTWKPQRLKDIADVIGGITKDSKKQNVEDEELPYLRVANVQRGYLDLTEMKTIRVPKQRLESWLLKFGDILFNEGGDIDKLGRGWVWSGEIERCIFQNHVFRARLKDSTFVPKYFSHYGNSRGYDYFLAYGKQTTNLASINKTIIEALPVAVPPPDEQVEIVRRVEKLFAYAERLEARYKSASEHVARLTPSLLAKAFRGELVEQVEGDEVLKVYKIK
jgi:type I restriction enzyme S subunit